MGSSTAGWEEKTGGYGREGKTERKKNNTQKMCMPVYMWMYKHTRAHTYIHTKIYTHTQKTGQVHFSVNYHK